MAKDLIMKFSSPQKRREILEKEREVKAKKDIERHKRKKDLAKRKAKYEKTK